MHLLIFLNQEDKILNANNVDDIVSAQIPDPELHPLLYQTVTNCMLHGPCGDHNRGAPCMVDGSCGKHFPKPSQRQLFMVKMDILNMQGPIMVVL